MPRPRRLLAVGLLCATAAGGGRPPGMVRIPAKPKLLELVHLYQLPPLAQEP